MSSEYGRIRPKADDKCGICAGDMIDDPESEHDGECSWCGASSWWIAGRDVDSRVIRELRGYLIHAREGKLPGQSGVSVLKQGG